MSISLFEIVGPVMIGPSSSGTAGMARIGAVAHDISEGIPAKIDVCFHPRHYEGYAGCRSHYAAVGGALGMSPEDDNIRNALEEAEKRNITVSVSFFEPPLPKEGLTVRISIENTDGKKFSVLGISLGGGMIDILEINGKPAGKHNENTADAGSTEEHNNKKDVTPLFTSCCEYVRLSEKYEDPADNAFAYEIHNSGKSTEELKKEMHRELEVMQSAVKRGLNEKPRGLYGFVNGDEGAKIKEAYDRGKLYDSILPQAIAKAVATMNTAMSMGTIVAAPTSGSCGILPGCLLTVQEQCGFDDDRLIGAMFTAAALGAIMRYHGVRMSGMEGGCQGEVGVSSAMAAGALVYLRGGSASEICHAAALALKGMMGLICDPIGANSEIPCVKRNAAGVGNAFAAADMALAGIKSFIPPDEVIDALVHVQARTPECFRCGDSGLYSSPTACRARHEEKLIDAAIRSESEPRQE